MNPQTRSRLTLVAIVVLFFASFGVALFLHYSGWEPVQTRNHGEFIEPVIDLTGVELVRADGERYPWNPREGVWRVIAVPPAQCGHDCLEMVDVLRRVWVGEGRHADNLHVLWFGEVPEGAAVFRNLIPMQVSPELLQALPEASEPGAFPVSVADPSGYLVLHYPPGFDPGGLRRDLARLIK